MSVGLIIQPLDFWASTRPGHPALIMNERVVSFASLARWTDTVASDLSRKGVRPGDVVAVAGANSLEWIAAALGTLKAGAVLAPMNHRSVADEFEYLLNVLRPKIVLADEARSVLLAPLLEKRRIQTARLEDVCESAPAKPWTIPQVAPSAPAVLVFTSGSSDHPKGVIHTHETIMAAYLERKLIEDAYTPEMRLLFVFSLYALPGTIAGFLSTCFHGGTFVLESGFDPARTLEKLQEHRISIFQGVPILFDQISRQPGFAAADLSSLRSVHIGGAPVSLALVERWRGKKVLLRQLYGMTEVCGGATVSTDDEARAGKDTCGRGGIFTKIRVVDRDGKDCPPGVPGHVLVRGPACSPGYWANEAATAALYVDGWLKAGDIGSIDENGFFKYIDRAKDMIISGGINISPADIERVIAGFAPGAEVAVIAAQDEKFGETPAALVHATDGFDMSACIAYCGMHLTDYKVPRYIVLLDQPLPRQTSGKIDKRRLKAEFGDISSRYERVR